MQSARIPLVQDAKHDFFDRGKRLGVYHRRLVLLTGVINVDGSHAYGFPSTVWGTRRVCDIFQAAHKAHASIQIPRYGPITTALVFLSLVSTSDYLFLQHIAGQRLHPRLHRQRPSW